MEQLRNTIGTYAQMLRESIKLRELIRQVRQCKTAAQERELIAKESARLREYFKEQDSVFRARNVAKLMYIHMLGYPTHFGQMECVKLAAAQSYAEKRIGYLAVMILLDERSEVLMLVTNCIKQDINSKNQYIAGLALCTLGNICSAEMGQDLSPDVERLMGNSNSYIKKKATLCAVRIIKKVPDIVEQFVPRSKQLLADRHHGVILAGITLVLEICKLTPQYIEAYRPHVPSLCRVMKQLCTSGVVPDYDVGGINDPFLQVKLLRLLRVLGRGNSEAGEQMADVLAQVGTNTIGSRSAGNGILYECVQTIMGLEAMPGLRSMAVNILGRFLGNKDNNIKYVALHTLSKVVKVDTAAVQRHRAVIVECVKDADISIRRRALDLVYALVNSNNITALTKELLEYLQVADESFKADLANKICTLIQKFSPSREWHIKSMMSVLQQAGQHVKEEAVHALIVVVSNSVGLQGYAARQCYKALPFDDLQEKQPPITLLTYCIWVLGECGDQLVPGNKGLIEGEAPIDVSAEQVVGGITKVLEWEDACPVVRQYALAALMKLSARFTQVSPQVEKTVAKWCNCVQLEVSNRSCEYVQILAHNGIRGQLLERMPAIDEAGYAQNLATDVADAVAAKELSSNSKRDSGLGDLLDIMDGSTTVTPAPASAQAAIDMLDDLLGDGLSSSQQQQQQQPQQQPNMGLGANSISIGDQLDLLDMQDSKPAPAEAVPPLTAVQHDSIMVIFNFKKGPGGDQQTVITATLTTTHTADIQDVTMQAAVPKFMTIKLDPPSSKTIPANGSGNITQVMHVTNSMHGQKPLAMRLRMSYAKDGTTVTEQFQINNFPPNL